MRDELSQSFAFLPRRSEPWIWISKPMENSVKKLIGERSASTAAPLPERPAENLLRRKIISSSHSSQPMVDESGLPDTGPGNDGHDIHLRLCPRIIQESHILFSTKNIAACHWQTGY